MQKFRPYSVRNIAVILIMKYKPVGRHALRIGLRLLSWLRVTLHFV